jgi:hypothetical protein
MTTLNNIFSSVCATELPYKTSLKDFLKFLAVVEEGVVDDCSVEDQKSFFTFKNLITDLNRCAISGSAVLEHRMNKEPEANDLDFFIEGTEENSEIIKDFFTDPKYGEIFKKFQENFLPKTHIKLGYPKGYYERVVYDEYSFVKHDVKINTSRFAYSHSDTNGFRLNFIFITPLTREERQLLQIEEKMHGKLYIDRLFREETFDKEVGSIKLLIDSGCTTDDIREGKEAFQENNELIANMPLGIPIHHIHATFDFEELKYVYSFEVQQVISTFIAGKILLKGFNDFIKDMRPASRMKDMLYARIERMIESLAARNEEFVLNTSEQNTLTISNGSYTPNMIGALRRTNDQQISWRKSLEEVFDGMQTKSINNISENVMKAYHNLMIRVPKYQERGYNIKDPKKIIAHTQYFMALYNAYISSNPILNQIAIKSCLLEGEKIDTIKAKIVKNWTKSLELFRETAEIKLKEDIDESQTTNEF